MISVDEMKNIISNYFIVTIDTIKFDILASLFIINEILFEDEEKIKELELRLQNIELEENDIKIIDDIIARLIEFNSKEFGVKIRIMSTILNDNTQFKKSTLIKNFINFITSDINNKNENVDIEFIYDKIKINDVLYFNEYFDNTYAYTYTSIIYDIDVFKKIITKFIKMNKMFNT